MKKMASLTLTSPCITSNIFNTETISSKNRRDDSFSSYLNLIRESLAKDQSDHDSGDSTPTTMRISIGKTQGEDGELDIFRAEKYFSGVMDIGDTSNMEKSPVIMCGSNYKKEGKMMMSLKSISMSESTCSETSANSRNTLLRDHRRKLSSSSSNWRRRRLLRVFRCSCSGKDATRVEEDILNGNKNYKQEHFVQRSSFATKIEDGLTFMTLNSQMGAAARMTIQKETFGSPFIEKGVMVSTLRKSLTLLTPPLTTKQLQQQQEEEEDDDDDDDLLSETSSDLFEIDSLSMNGNHNLFRPESGYEPSEVSIDWSVTTASAAGNIDERRLDHDEGKRPSKSGKHSMFLGCSSEKAVNVTTENNYSKKPERLSSVSNNHEQIMRFESLPPLLMRYHASQAVQSRHSLDFTHGRL